MRNRRRLNILLVLALLVGMVQTTFTVQSQAHTGIRLEDNGENYLILEGYSPDYNLQQIERGGGGFTRLQASEADRFGEAGHPELPVYTALIGVPADATLEVRLIEEVTRQVKGSYMLAPVGTPSALEEDLQPGEYDYEPELSAYRQEAWLPGESVQIDAPAWVGNQRIARISYFPFEYHPASGKLIWHPLVRAEIHFLKEKMEQPPRGASLQTNGNPFETSLASSLLNYQQARGWRSLPRENDTTALPQLSPDLPVPNYRIPILADGIYKLTYAELQAAGLPVDSLDPRTFKLSNQGQEVAIFVENNDDEAYHFRPGGYVLFYGEKFRGEGLAAQYADENQHWLNFETAYTTATLQSGALTIDNTFSQWYPRLNATQIEKYTDENVYWLTYGGSEGMRLVSLDGTPGSAEIVGSYRETVRNEESHLWKTTLFNGEDTWFWNQAQPNPNNTTITLTYPIDVSAMASGIFSATLRGEILAETRALGFPDHQTQIWMNALPGEEPLMDITWDDKGRLRFEAEIPQSRLIEGTNTLRVEYLKTAAVTADSLFFNWFEVEYSRAFAAANDQIKYQMDSGGAQRYQIGGFSGQPVLALEVSNPAAAQMIQNTSLAAGELTFETTLPSGAVYFIGPAQEVDAGQIKLFTPPDWNQEAEYVLVTHSSLITATQSLADYRTAQGLSTRVIDIEDLYNEFFYGIYHPLAIKNFLRYAFANWGQAPQYLILVGDGHWNFKGYTNPGAVYDGLDKTSILIPPNLVWADPWQGEVDSANLLANVVGDDPLADVHIARLPARSAQEVSDLVAKISAYESAPEAGWQARVTFVADNSDLAGNFPALSELVIDGYVPADFEVDRIYQDDYNCVINQRCEAVNDAIINTLNMTGTLLINYTGHASLDRWSHERILINSDIPEIQNDGQLPVFLSMDCLDGYWSYPGREGLIEELVRKPDQGAIAAFSPTGLGVATGHDALHQGFYQTLFNNGIWSLAEAAQGAKLRLYATGNNYDLLHTFTVFGDPALAIHNPYSLYFGVDENSKEGVVGSGVEYLLRLENTATITDTVAIGTLSGTWPISLPEFAEVPLSISVPPGTVITMSVAVTVPLTVRDDASDAAVIRVAGSNGDEYERTLTTSAIGYDLLLSPLSKTANGFYSELATFEMTLINIGSFSDTYDLEMSGGAWDWGIGAPVGSITLAPGESTPVTVYADVPLNPSVYTDQANLVATSRQPSTFSAQASLTANAVSPYAIAAAADQLVLTGPPGGQIEYRIAITNTGRITDSYSVETSDYSPWTVVLEPSVSVGPVVNGEVGELIVRVGVPVAAKEGALVDIYILIHSIHDPSKSVLFKLTAKAQWNSKLYLPAVERQ